ncbi:hypothetical protein, partial [Burkholderia pseudomallei]
VEASKRRSVEASKRRSVEASKPRSPEAPKPRSRLSTPRMQARFRRRSISRRLSRASRGGARNRLYRRCRFSPHPYAA